MSRMQRTALEAECRALARVLTRDPPTPYLITKYCEAHARSDQFGSSDRFDRWLLSAACRHPVVARLADGYARQVLPRSILRRKLILLLALLEVTPPHHRLVRPAVRSRTGVVAALALHGVVGIAVGALGILVFGPAHLAARLLGDRRG